MSFSGDLGRLAHIVALALGGTEGGGSPFVTFLYF